MISRKELEAKEEEERILRYAEQDRQKAVTQFNRESERATRRRMYFLMFGAGAAAWALFAWLS